MSSPWLENTSVNSLTELSLNNNSNNYFEDSSLFFDNLMSSTPKPQDLIENQQNFSTQKQQNCLPSNFQTSTSVSSFNQQNFSQNSTNLQKFSMPKQQFVNQQPQIINNKNTNKMFQENGFLLNEDAGYYSGGQSSPANMYSTTYSPSQQDQNSPASFEMNNQSKTLEQSFDCTLLQGLEGSLINSTVALNNKNDILNDQFLQSHFRSCYSPNPSTQFHNQQNSSPAQNYNNMSNVPDQNQSQLLPNIYPNLSYEENSQSMANIIPYEHRNPQLDMSFTDSEYLSPERCSSVSTCCMGSPMPPPCVSPYPDHLLGCETSSSLLMPQQPAMAQPVIKSETPLVEDSKEEACLPRGKNIFIYVLHLIIQILLYKKFFYF